MPTSVSQPVLNPRPSARLTGRAGSIAARLTLFVCSAALMLHGCDGRNPTATRGPDHAVNLQLAANVVAAAGANVEAIVTYAPDGETPVTLARQSTSITTGGAGAVLSVTANVEPCLSAAVEGACVIDVTIRLTRDGAVLDESTQRFTVGPSTVTLNAAPVQLFEVSSVVISGSTTALANFEPGDGVLLTATSLDRNGATVAGRSATWSVVSGGVTVATTGQMSAVSPGPAVVRASMAGRTQDLSVTVKQPSVDTLTLAPLDTTITVGTSFTYRVTAKSPYGVALLNRPITVTSSGSGIASVTPLVVGQSYTTHGLQPGLVTITATSTQGRGGATVTRATTLRVLPAQGRLSGLVANASNSAPIAGASVQIRRASDNTLVNTVTTAANGSWTSIPLDAATYNLQFVATGFTTVSVTGVSLAGGPSIPTTPVSTVLLVPTGAGNGVISGSVRDATTNNIIVAATVELRAGSNNLTGTPIAISATSSDGLYAFPSQPSGAYTVRAAKAGFVDGSTVVTISGSDVTAPTVLMSPISGMVAWRFVLQWGATPEDLDAHLTGPIPSSAARFHVWFAEPGSLTTSPFAVLDIDQTYGYGPETITMSQQFAGTYRYYVDNYSGESPLKSSSARVNVYQGNLLVATFTPPQQDGEYWTVFEITDGVLVPINAIGVNMPSMSAANANAGVNAVVTGPRNPKASAASEWNSLMPWSWRRVGKTSRPHR